MAVPDEQLVWDFGQVSSLGSRVAVAARDRKSWM